MLSTSTLVAVVVVAAASLVAAQTATVVIEASHGGANSDLTNTTVTVPLNTLYVNAALDEVSTLYLTAADGATLSTITCTPYRYANLTGNSGLPFTSSTPSYLSTNTVPVGSLECSSYGGSTATSSSASLTSAASALSSAASSAPSSVSITGTRTGTTTGAPSTLTSGAASSGSHGSSSSVSTTTSGGQAPSTTSASPSSNSQSAGKKLTLGTQLLSLCAIVGVGVAAII